MTFQFFSDDSAPENFVNFVEAVNKNLRSLDMEIRQGISEDSGAVHYGLVRTRQQSSNLGRFPFTKKYSSWDVNGTHIFHTFHLKIPSDKWDFEKVVPLSCWKLSGGNACSIYEFSQGITSSRLFIVTPVSPS